MTPQLRPTGTSIARAHGIELPVHTGVSSFLLSELLHRFLFVRTLVELLN